MEENEPVAPSDRVPHFTHNPYSNLNSLMKNHTTTDIIGELKE
jgi:hypothetical protein